MPKTSASGVMANILRAVRKNDIKTAIHHFTKFCVYHALGDAGFLELAMRSRHHLFNPIVSPPEPATARTTNDLAATSEWIGRFFGLTDECPTSMRPTWATLSEQVIESYAVGVERWRDLGCSKELLTALGFFDKEEEEEEGSGRRRRESSDTEEGEEEEVAAVPAPSAPAPSVPVASAIEG